MKKLFPAIFLDRDGVIIQNRPEYVRSLKDVQFIPHIKEALSQITKSHYKIVIVTNQSVVGRKIISLEQANLINQYIVKKIAAMGGRIDGVFMCPHRPDENCLCRKPQSGLFLEASRTLSLDLGNSLVFGDTWDDLLAGRRAGLRQYGLVLTGRGKEQFRMAPPEQIKNARTFPNLVTAVKETVPITN